MIQSNPPITEPQLQILVDTSFLLTLLRQHRDLDEEIRTAVSGKVRIAVLDLVVLELERLARRGSASARNWAEVSLAYLRAKKYPVVEHKTGPSDVDASLVVYALAERAPTGIATVDGELRFALESLSIPAIWPRTRHGLVAERFHF
jgi:rRNA-processing protein FCF1